MPYCIFSPPGESPRVGLRQGGRLLDLSVLAEAGAFDFDASVFFEPYLNEFMALGRAVHKRARPQVQAFVENSQRLDEAVADPEAVTFHLPVRIGDYTDFYSSLEHATNVGKLFRDPENALLPNWRHLPVGYHGRASSIVVSGTPIRRPYGQVKTNAMDAPAFRPSNRLDFELEMGFVIGKDSVLGEPVPVADAEEYVFGLVLFNDWSARDIQKWEYVPLGPFLGKSFASSLGPWVVPLEDLDGARTAGPEQEPVPLPYLLRPDSGITDQVGTSSRVARDRAHFDIELTAELTPRGGTPTVISRSNTKHLYWSIAQQIAHHTSNGCNLRVGDLLATGTISAPGTAGYGSLLEASHGGRQPLMLADGQLRAFLEDGDTVTLRARAGGVDFGSVTGTITPAR